jgi:hypothetical protein
MGLMCWISLRDGLLFHRQILNHQSGHKRGPAGIYNRSSCEREVRAALALWADHVRSLVEGDERKVLPFVSGQAT